MSPQLDPQEPVDGTSVPSTGFPQDKYRDGNAKWETGEIPPVLREEVLERDKGHCRVCGGVPESPALHHIKLRSRGGLNEASNLVVVHWMFWPRCHEVVHSNTRLWTPALEAVVERPGLTARQWLRWERRRLSRSGPG